VGSNGKLLYVDLNQYTTKAYGNSDFCAATWDLRDPSGNIADDMSQVCGAVADLTSFEKLQQVLSNICGISKVEVKDNFDEATGIYDGSLDCSYKSMDDGNFSAFSIIREVSGSLTLAANHISNVDPLSTLTKVGGYLYLYNNPLQNINGLSALITVEGDLRITDTNLTDLNGLISLETLNGVLSINSNPFLIDISAFGDLKAFDGKQITIDRDQYINKAGDSSSFCAAVWDIYDDTGNIADDMSQICEGASYEATPVNRLRDAVGRYCQTTSFDFYQNYSEAEGKYSGNLNCENSDLNSSALEDFDALLEVEGDFLLSSNMLTNLDGLIKLRSVSKTFSIYNNPNLIDIYGISNVGMAGSSQILRIDPANQYTHKADIAKDFCQSSWNVYEGTSNISDDKSAICFEY